MSSSDKFIYLLSSRKEYDEAKDIGFLFRESLKIEGFIHASPKEQLNRVANKYYKETIKPLVIVVEQEKVSPEVKWESAAGSLYPHIYGPLNMDATVKDIPISLNSDGLYDISFSLK
ncbi:MAG: DUF952 domain-containing protein [Lentisphaeraceae bacterium]|nr:DUF952 domain-containing protein [Lentisphaeraceae bacterium]